MAMHKLPVPFTYYFLKSQDYSATYTDFSKKIVTLVDYFTTNGIKWNQGFILTLVQMSLSPQ